MIVGCNRNETISTNPPSISFDYEDGAYTATRGETITLRAIVTNADDNDDFTWYRKEGPSGDYKPAGTGLTLPFEATVAGTHNFLFKAETQGGSAERYVIVKVYYPAPEVYEFMPAPGQFVNENYTAATKEEACLYAKERMEEYNYVSLGGFGGYIVMGFGRDQSILNRTGEDDFAILGNSYKGSSEPGIVWVMKDENDNGKPDDTWYELRGSEDEESQNGPVRGYWVTYTRPAAESDPVSWVDSDGETGTIDRIGEHKQAYYPRWITEGSYTLHGTRLSPRNYQDNRGEWVNAEYGWGYADNYEADGRKEDNKPMANYFRIENAVDELGQPMTLDRIDFVKVQTAVNAKSGALGEISTEVCGLIDLNKE